MPRGDKITEIAQCNTPKDVYEAVQEQETINADINQ
jgi:hypothetical protein